MNEQDTFAKLKRIPLNEMIDLVDNYEDTNSVMIFYDRPVHEHQLYGKFSQVYELTKLLDLHGWNVEDFNLELERKGIIDAVELFNNTVLFPQELIDRAKKFFPNIEITHTRIDLNE